MKDFVIANNKVLPINETIITVNKIPPIILTQ